MKTGTCVKMHPDTGREQVGKCAMGNTHGKGGSTDWVLFRSPWPHYKLLAAWTPWVLHIPFHICAIFLLIFLVQSGFRHRALDALYSPSAPGILPRVPLQTLLEPTPYWGTVVLSSALSRFPGLACRLWSPLGSLSEKSSSPRGVPATIASGLVRAPAQVA